MPNQYLPDTFGAMTNAFAAGQDIRKRKDLNALAATAYGSNGDARAQALQQAVAIDADAGLALDRNVQSREEAMLKKLGGAARYLKQAVDSGNPRQVQGAYQAVLPMLRREMPQGQFADTWDPATMEPVLHQVLAMTSGAPGGEAPAGFQELHMKALAAGLQPGTPEYQEAMNIALGRQGRAATGGFGFETVKGADGRERMGRTNPRTGVFEVYDEASGSFAPLGGGGSLNGGTVPPPMQAPPVGIPQFTAADGDQTAVIEQEIGRPLSQAERAQIAAGTFRLDVPVNANALPPPIEFAPAVSSGNPGLAVSRTPEQEAAAKEAATQAVQLEYLPRTEAVKTQAAIAQAAGTATAKGESEARLEAIQNLPRVMQESNNAIGLIDKALNHPGRATATGMSGKYDPRNYAPGTDATNFRVLLDQIKGGTFLQAFQMLKGGGAITTVEGTKAEQAIARLDTAQSDEEFVTALNDLRKIATDAQTRAQDRISQFSPNAAAPAAAGPVIRYDAQGNRIP